MRIALAIGAIITALLPATIGLLGNTTFSQSVPVRVPASAQVLPADDSSATGTPTSTSSPRDDNGGDRPRDSRVEPGDDRDASPTASSTPTSTSSPRDDKGGLRSGSDDSDPDDRGGHGSDD
nr:hypothetical protein [Propionibacterium sp.]